MMCGNNVRNLDVYINCHIFHKSNKQFRFSFFKSKMQNIGSKQFLSEEHDDAFFCNIHKKFYDLDFCQCIKCADSQDLIKIYDSSSNEFLIFDNWYKTYGSTYEKNRIYRHLPIHQARDIFLRFDFSSLKCFFCSDHHGVLPVVAHVNKTTKIYEFSSQRLKIFIKRKTSWSLMPSHVYFICNLSPVLESHYFF